MASPGGGQSPFLPGEVKLNIVGRVAYLEGRVCTYQQKKEIGRITASLPGVERVVNRVRVIPYTARPDREILEDVKAALRSAPELSDLSIGIQVRDGVVDLMGAVPDVRARIAAEAAAWSVWGVRHVVNHLEAVSAGELDSEALADALSRSLAAALGPGVGSVEVDFRRDTVYLRGWVRSEEERLAAEDVLRWHPQVRRVVNEIKVRELGPLSTPAA